MVVGLTLSESRPVKGSRNSPCRRVLNPVVLLDMCVVRILTFSNPPGLPKLDSLRFQIPMFIRKCRSWHGCSESPENTKELMSGLLDGSGLAMAFRHQLLGVSFCQAPVDLRLDSQELRSVADIRAVVEAHGARWQAQVIPTELKFFLPG